MTTAVLTAHGAGTAGPGLARLGGRPGMPRVLCFPHAGGSRVAFRSWAADLPDVHLLGWTMPGRGARRDQPLRTSWAGLGDEIAGEVASLPAAPATVVYGHSLGALVAVEAARALTAAGGRVARVVVSGRASADTGPVLRWPDDDDALLDLLEFRYGGIPAEVRAEPELLAALLPALRADLALVTAPRPDGPRLSCPFTVLRGTRDRSLCPADEGSWASVTTGPVATVLVDAAHLPLDHYRAAAVRALRPALEEARP